MKRFLAIIGLTVLVSFLTNLLECLCIEQADEENLDDRDILDGLG